ncbi:MAG: hypothetical protein IKU26_00610 [Clostridia bacterium]|nr:hypothetical protein [Clostridia bacterium]
MRFVSLLLLLCLCFTFIPGVNSAQAQATAFDAKEYTLTHLTATDAVNRTLPAISGYKSDKQVGIFYFLWHGQHNPGKTVRNVTELLKTNYDDLFDTDPNNAVVPENAWLHVNEPLYGYYNSYDKWVMRKHIELFIAADVDFVLFDLSNGYSYFKPMQNFLDLLLEYKEAGWDVPQVSCYLWIDGNDLMDSLLWSKIYTNEKYKDLIFSADGEKPLLVASLKMDPQGKGQILDKKYQDYFDVRQSAVSYAGDDDNLWPYWQFKRDWKVYTDMVNVSSAQAGNAFSFYYHPANGYNNEVHGRGWSSSNPKNGDIQAILRGDNAQEGWDNAIAKDPDIIFVCGWNEWVVQKAFLPDGTAHYTDNFSVEFSRDIEMLKSATYVPDGKGGYTEEGFGDNYYLQLAYNIRRYKGIAATETDYPDPMTIDINGNLAQWDLVKEKYLAISTNKEARNANGFYLGLKYQQAAPANVVDNVQVAYDDNNVYFKITATDAISKYKSGSTNWMNLLIGVEGSDQAAWSNFNYVINRTPGSNGKTSVEHFTQNGAYTLTKSGEASYNVSGNVLQIAIPRSVLGITKDGFNLTFKVTDSIEKQDDILDYYVSGEAFPVGRYAYTYQTTYSESAPMPTNNPTLNTQAPDTTPGGDSGDANESADSDNGLILGLCIAGGAVVVMAVVIILVVCLKKKEG